VACETNGRVETPWTEGASEPQTSSLHVGARHLLDRCQETSRKDEPWLAESMSLSRLQVALFFSGSPVSRIDASLVDAARVRGLRLCRADAAQLDCRLDLVRASVPVRSVLRGAGFFETHH
jgi:hypothetical protein